MNEKTWVLFQSLMITSTIIITICQPILNYGFKKKQHFYTISLGVTHLNVPVAWLLRDQKGIIQNTMEENFITLRFIDL